MGKIVEEFSKNKIVALNAKLRLGQIDANEYSRKLQEIVTTIYDEGREMGMTEALNYVANESDRKRLFAAIDELAEEIDNNV